MKSCSVSLGELVEFKRSGREKNHIMNRIRHSVQASDSGVAFGLVGRLDPLIAADAEIEIEIEIEIGIGIDGQARLSGPGGEGLAQRRRGGIGGTGSAATSVYVLQLS